MKMCRACAVTWGFFYIVVIKGLHSSFYLFMASMSSGVAVQKSNLKFS